MYRKRALFAWDSLNEMCCIFCRAFASREGAGKQWVWVSLQQDLRLTSGHFSVGLFPLLFLGSFLSLYLPFLALFSHDTRHKERVATAWLLQRNDTHIWIHMKCRRSRRECLGHAVYSFCFKLEKNSLLWSSVNIHEVSCHTHSTYYYHVLYL